MVRTYAQAQSTVQRLLQDSTTTLWNVTDELADFGKWALAEISYYVPYWRVEGFPIESRYGTASSTAASALVDSTQGQFLSTDTDKKVYNESDKTWAIVTAFASTAQLTLSQDIMASGESYKLFNKNCYNERQVDFSKSDDYIISKEKEIVAEYPYGRFRNVKILDQRKVLEIKYDGVMNNSNTASSSSYKEIMVHLPTFHRLVNLSDTAGAVNNSAGYALATTSMAVDGLANNDVIPKDTLFTIDTVRGTYRTTAAVTLSGSGSTAALPFYPGLLDVVVDNDVVNFVPSTLDPMLEEILITLWAYKAAVSKSRSSVSKAADLIAWGNFTKTEAYVQLERMKEMNPVKLYPRT